MIFRPRLGLGHNHATVKKLGRFQIVVAPVIFGCDRVFAALDGPFVQIDKSFFVFHVNKIVLLKLNVKGYLQLFLSTMRNNNLKFNNPNPGIFIPSPTTIY